MTPDRHEQHNYVIGNNHAGRLLYTEHAAVTHDPTEIRTRRTAITALTLG